MRGGSQYVRGQHGVGGPAGRVLRVAGGGGDQQCDHLLGGGLLPVGGHLLTDHGLHPPVQLKAARLAAGQGVADQVADGIGQGVGIGGGDGPQRLVQQRSVLAEKNQGDGFGGEEGGPLQQLGGGRGLLAQPVEGQCPGGIEPSVVADHVAAGQQGGAVGAEAAQVVGRRQVGLLQIAGGLGGGQRQVPELRGEFVGQ